LKFKEVTAILTTSSSGEADLCARTFSSCSSWREEEDERSTYQTEEDDTYYSGDFGAASNRPSLTFGKLSFRN